MAEENSPAAMAAKGDLVKLAPLAHLSNLDSETTLRLHKALSAIALSEADASLAARATIALALSGDASSIAKLATWIGVPKTPIPKTEILSGFPASNPPPPALLRKALETAVDQNDEETAIATLRVLTGDADS